MRLALMELDRENGVDVGDGLSSADRLAGTSMPKRRRRDAESDARTTQGQGEGRGRGKGRGKAETPEAEEAAGGRRRRKRTASVDNGEAAGKNASRESARLSSPAAKSRRWHEPHAPSSPSPVERGARGRLPRRSRSRGRCRSQGWLGFRRACRQGWQAAWRGGARVTSASSPFLGHAAEALGSLLWPIRFRMAKSRSRAVAPAMAEELPPRLRTAALATSANRVRIAAARARPTRVKSVAVAVAPASRARTVAKARPAPRPYRNRLPANNVRKRM